MIKGDVPPASTIMYFSPALKALKMNLSLSFSIGMYMQYKEAASGSRAIIKLSLRTPA